MRVGQHKVEAIVVLRHVRRARATDDHAKSHLKAIAKENLGRRMLHLFRDL